MEFLTRRFFDPSQEHEKKKFHVKVTGIKRDPKGQPILDERQQKQRVTLFEMNDVEAPASWTPHAVEIAASKYFVKARVPGVMSDGRGYENSVFAMVDRVAGTIAEAGERLGYFTKPADGDHPSVSIFFEELSEILLSQRAAFNSPVWFNVGLWHKYGIEGNGVNFAVDLEAPEIPHTTPVMSIANYYARPQASACFIQPVGDSLEELFGLLSAESRVFKGGSGTGTNFSKIRSRFEPLAGGGKSSGLISFLKVFDAAAGSIKSGGVTRRAAKMVIVDYDHPEIFDFVSWKVSEEKKAKMLIASGMDPDFNGDAYQTVSGQNSNNSIRVNDYFMHAVEAGDRFVTTYRTDGKVHEERPARELFRAIAEAAWECGDPGLQYDSTIQKWHTVPHSGRINGSNPCAEFLHVDNSACNLASINLLKFVRSDGTFDVAAFRHTCHILILAMDILVDLSSYPTPELARMSHELRPLGLGFANLGAMLMRLGIPYDSDAGRSWAAGISSLMTAEAYAMSGVIAKVKGAFKQFAKNEDEMRQVIKQHADAASNLAVGSRLYGGELAKLCEEASRTWFAVGAKAVTRAGFRNAQATLLAPTGTISFLMSCDTTGVEPDYALVKHKSLAGGGDMVIVNATVEPALRALGYSEEQTAAILLYVNEHGVIDGAPGLAAQDREVFDCADRIRPMGHLLMVACVQPFLSGAVSKTINVPSQTTVEEFEELYLEGWRCGLKCISIYRDGCKGSQPLNAPPKKEERPINLDALEIVGELQQLRQDVITLRATRDNLAAQLEAAKDLNDRLIDERNMLKVENARIIASVAEHRAQQGDDRCWLDDKKLYQEVLDDQRWTPSMLPKEVFLKNCAHFWECQTKNLPYRTPHGAPPERIRLPVRREGSTFELRIGDQKFYLRTGRYEDGRIGELFIDMQKQGSMVRAMLNSFAIAISLGLQYGVPLEEFVDVFTFTRFEPSGVTNHPNIRMATSVIDLVFRVLGVEYLGRNELAQNPPVPPSEASSPDLQAIAPQDHPTISVEELLARRPAPPKPRPLSSNGDAPPCPNCGELTIRNGTCYKCANCGESLGCS